MGEEFLFFSIGSLRRTIQREIEAFKVKIDILFLLCLYSRERKKQISFKLSLSFFEKLLEKKTTSK
jgi:hypothetical protein